MLDAFEARLTDLVADRLAGVAEVHLVARPRSDLGGLNPPADRAVVVTEVVQAAPDPRLGDDSRDREGAKGAYRLRTVLHLAGQATVTVRLAAGGGAPVVAARRGLLMGVLDRVLAAFHADRVRHGSAFATAVDQGFEIGGFRLARIESLPESAEAPAFVRAWYDFRGRFWPVEAPVEGDEITALPTRLAILPVQLPDRIRARIGGADVEIPLRLDLRTLPGTRRMLAARMLGAAPPGSLVDGVDGAPSGWTGYTPDPEGVARVRYRPPGAGSAMRIRVATALAAESGPTIPLVEFVVELEA